MDKELIKPTTSHLSHSLSTMGISAGTFVAAVYTLNVLPSSPVNSIIEFDEKWQQVWSKQARAFVEQCAEVSIVDFELAMEWIRRGQRFRTRRYTLTNIVYDYAPINGFLKAHWPDMNDDPRVEYAYQVMDKFISAIFSHRDDIMGLFMAGMGNVRARSDVVKSIVDGFLEALYEKEGTIPKSTLDFSRGVMMKYMWHMFVCMMEIHKAQVMSESADGFRELIKSMGFNENELDTIIKAVQENGGVFEGDKEKQYV